MKNNLQWKYENQDCRLCEKESETHQHILMCPEIKWRKYEEIKHLGDQPYGTNCLTSFVIAAIFAHTYIISIIIIIISVF